MDQVALVTFESNAYVEFYLNSYTNPKSIAKAVAKVNCHECANGETSVASALAIIKKQVLTNLKGYRPEVPRVVVIVTDRESSIEYWDSLKLAEEMAAIGVRIVVVGVTHQINKEELDSLATGEGSGPKKVHIADSFSDLKTLATQLRDQISKYKC